MLKSKNKSNNEKTLDQGENHLEVINGLEELAYGNTKTLDLF